MLEMSRYFRSQHDLSEHFLPVSGVLFEAMADRGSQGAMNKQPEFDIGRVSGIAAMATAICLTIYALATMFVYDSPGEMLIVHLRAPMITAVTLIVPLLLIFLAVSACVEWLRSQSPRWGGRAGQLSVGSVLVFALMAGFGYLWWSGDASGVLATSLAGLAVVPLLLWRSAGSAAAA